MKTLKGLVSALEVESLFHRPQSLVGLGLEEWMKDHKIKACSGKYSSSVKDKPIYHDNMVLWYTRGKDKHGTYYTLWTIDDESLATNEDKQLFSIIENVASKLN